ncbi:lipoate--protein ligase [Mycoplasmopsis alligatoris]|uniref:lipoate--protein ligase n=1 Tax=Mycoplasmopsis alligatoris A21JP2 TaxID=747682 RepID=D4XWJ3_9BACT|nr:lipoate--protein ligase [Mycoplasmopsis alligatoris]EFF41346.1 lipoyltransferase and lipoate-protein ligase [Mycoplasmopsis alligatoris A21JP2]
MKIFVSNNTSPYINLSIEELLVKDESITDNILYIYQHKNAIIIGKNQNAHEEINKDFVEQNKIEVSRRLSGGGAVYHDLGNINFSFISKNVNGGDYLAFLTPIIDFLNSLGLNAQFHGRNDLLCNGAKISGNAQYIYKNKIVSHGTLLFDVDLTKLSKALNPSKLKIESKGIQSIRSRVTNIAKELNYSMDVKTFIESLVDFFVKKYQAHNEEIPFSKYQKELDELQKLRSSESWIFDKQAKFSAQNIAKFPGGILNVKFNVENSVIKNIKFEGDFLSKLDVSQIENKLSGVKFSKAEVKKTILEFELEKYFGTLTIEEILSLIFGQNE